MTKKNFKEKCSFHEYGRGKNKRNAIFFDWQSNDKGNGFKFMVKTKVCNFSKQELFNHLYDWVTEKIQAPDWFVEYKYAKTDEERFKVPIMG